MKIVSIRSDNDGEFQNLSFERFYNENAFHTTSRNQGYHNKMMFLEERIGVWRNLQKRC